MLASAEGGLSDGLETTPAQMFFDSTCQNLVTGHRPPQHRPWSLAYAYDFSQKFNTSQDEEMKFVRFGQLVGLLVEGFGYLPPALMIDVRDALEAWAGPTPKGQMPRALSNYAVGY